LKLVRARITHYRSAEDSGELAVELDVTCLVGKNESGKTNVLQGLYRVNPVEPTAAFDEVVDFPAWLTRQRRDFPDGQMIPVVAATFRYDDEEIAAIENDLGAGALRSPEFTVTVGYRDQARIFTHDYDEAAIVRGLCAQLDLPRAATAALAKETTVAGLLQALDGLAETSAAAQELAARIPDLAAGKR
jgi:hypothetical protein